MFALVAFVANRLPVNRDIRGDDHVAAEDELAGGGWLGALCGWCCGLTR